MSETGERRSRRELHRPETGSVEGVAPDDGSAAPQPTPPASSPATPPVSRRAMREQSTPDASGPATDAVARSRRSIRDTALDPTSERPPAQPAPSV